MTEAAPRTERLHALDSLRAVMMLLGLVLHSGLTYGVTDYGQAWSLKDPETTNSVFDLLVAYIHTFRMPVFFVLSGFFGALLFSEKSPRAMLANRLSRVVYPFVLFLFLLWPTVVFAWVFTGASMKGNPQALADAVAVFGNPLVFIPGDTMHLWFLEYLILFSVAGWLFGSFSKGSPTAASQIRRCYELIMRSPLARPLLCAAMTFAMLYLMDSTWAEKTGGLIPAWKPLCLHFTFYFFGWLLYDCKGLVPGPIRHDWLLLALAHVAFAFKIGLHDSPYRVATMAVNALSVWCFVFAVTGLFVRYCAQPSARMRFASDASYWFYLIHLPLTALGAGLLIGSGLPSGIKFALVLGATTSVCWVTYVYLVRGSFVGLFLNGRKYPRR